MHYKALKRRDISGQVVNAEHTSEQGDVQSERGETSDFTGKKDRNKSKEQDEGGGADLGKIVNLMQ